MNRHDGTFAIRHKLVLREGSSPGQGKGSMRAKEDAKKTHPFSPQSQTLPSRCFDEPGFGSEGGRCRPVCRFYVWDQRCWHSAGERGEQKRETTHVFVFEKTDYRY